MLIHPNDSWALWACLTVLATAGLALERTRVGGRISGAVISILLGMFVANTGLAPHSSETYDLVWAWLLPLGIPLLLLDANLRRIFRESGPMLVACAIGAVGTFVGNLVAFNLVPLGEEGWKLTSVLTASYIGGSVNFFATARALGLDGDTSLLAAGAAADNLAMAAFFMLLFLLPSISWLRARFPNRSTIDASRDPSGRETLEEHTPISVQSLTAALAVAFSICAVGLPLGDRLPFAGGGILTVTLLSVAVATVFGSQLRSVQGHRQIGMALMQVFFVVIGLSADVGTVVAVAPLLFLYLALMLCIHLGCLLIGGRLVGLDLREIALASNVNAGGPTTAAAMAISQRWHALVVPAILCGTLGYAGANFAGLLMAWIIGP